MIENLEGEIWKPMAGLEQRYEISNMGRVKSFLYRGRHRTEILKPSVNHAGYLKVTLTDGKRRYIKRIHRLVYENFIGKIPQYKTNKDGNLIYEINHKDEDKTNNCVCNLELVTHTKNVNHGTALKRKSKTQTNGKKSKKVYQYDLKGSLINIWPSIAEAERVGCYSHGCVCDCCNNNYRRPKNNVYKNYIWSYVPLELNNVGNKGL